MRFTVSKEHFLKALTAVNHAIGAKNPIPALSNFKLDLTDRGLEITGSNSEITICSIVPYRYGEAEIIRNAGQGASLINARSLLEGVRKMSGTEISVDVIDECIAKVGDGKTSYKLPCVKADEYPDIDLEPTGVGLDLNCADLVSLVEATAFAASNKEQARPVLTALNLEAANGELSAVATDSARLAKKTTPIDSDVKFRANIPARILVDITHLLEGSQTVSLSVSANKALFRFVNTTVASRLIAGDYPVTKAIIPQSFNYYLEVNASELLSAMGRVSVLSVDRDPVVTLTMQEEEVIVSTKNDVAGSAEETLGTCRFSGQRLQVSFNSLFVNDAIKALKAEDVTICFQGEMKPFVVRDSNNPSVVELITPMRTY